MRFLTHLFFPLILRTRILYLRSPGTKEPRRHQPRHFMELYRRPMVSEPEIPWSLCKPLGIRAISAWLLSDFALSHSITEEVRVRRT